MIRLCLLLLAICQLAVGQESSPAFDTKFYDARDRWVLFDKQEGESTYSLGLIFIDPKAGYTFHFEAAVEMRDGHLEKLPRLDSSAIRTRLDRNTMDVALLSPSQIEALELEDRPEWLQAYRDNQEFISHRVGVGSAMNGAGASHLALPILLNAYQEDPSYPGLKYEIGFAYNATGSFYKAVMILNQAIESDPQSFWYYRELGFALKHLNNLSEAEKAYKKGIELTSDAFQRAEMAINMTQSYFHIKDRAKFDEWKNIVLANAEEEPMFLEYIQYFEDNWN
ncbi:MAG: hypothetical protein ACTHZ1_09635 [Sphingobacterium sp.]